MFFKKKKKIICPLSVIIGLIRDTDDGGTAEFIIDLDGDSHLIAKYGEYSERRDKYYASFHVDLQDYADFEEFSAAELCGSRLCELEERQVEVTSADFGTRSKFPWHEAFEKYAR